MRTNIEIDDELMKKAMQAGPYQTKKDAVEAGLKLLARQVTYREIIKWRGKLKWEGDESIDWTKPEVAETAPEPEPARQTDATLIVSEALPAEWPKKTTGRKAAPATTPTPKAKRRAGR